MSRSPHDYGAVIQKDNASMASNYCFFTDLVLDWGIEQHEAGGI